MFCGRLLNLARIGVLWWRLFKKRSYWPNNVDGKAGKEQFSGKY